MKHSVLRPSIIIGGKSSVQIHLWYPCRDTLWASAVLFPQDEASVKVWKHHCSLSYCCSLWWVFSPTHHLRFLFFQITLKDNWPTTLSRFFQPDKVSPYLKLTPHWESWVYLSLYSKIVYIMLFQKLNFWACVLETTPQARPPTHKKTCSLNPSDLY